MMKKTGLLAFGLGVPAAVLRGMDILHGYDAVTGVPSSTSWMRYLIWALSIVVLAVTFFATANSKHCSTHYETLFPKPTMVSKTAGVLASGIIFVGGVIGLAYTVLSGNFFRYDALTNTQNFDFATAIPLLGLWGFAILTAVSLLIILRVRGQGKISEKGALFTLFPLYFAAFDLIVTFKEASTSPFVCRYSMDLVCAIMLMLAFYLHAAILYGKPRVRYYQVVSALGIFFSVTGIGEAVASLMHSELFAAASVDAICRSVCFVGVAVWLASESLNITEEKEISL